MAVKLLAEEKSSAGSNDCSAALAANGSVNIAALPSAFVENPLPTNVQSNHQDNRQEAKLIHRQPLQAALLGKWARQPHRAQQGKEEYTMDGRK